MGIHSSVGGATIPFFPRILVVVLFRIVLYEIVQNFAYNILILQDDIHIIFVSIPFQGALLFQFAQNFGENADLVF